MRSRAAICFRRPPPRQTLGDRAPQCLAGHQFRWFRPRPRGFGLLIGSIGQVVACDHVRSDLPRHRRLVFADPGRDRGHRLPGRQPVGDIESVLQRQITITDHRHGGIDGLDHRMFVAGAGPIVHHGAVWTNPRLTRPADPRPPILGGPIVHPDRGSGFLHRRPRRDQLQKPLPGCRFPGPGQPARPDRPISSQDPASSRERDSGSLRSTIHRSCLIEHPPDQNRIGCSRRTPGLAQRNTLRPQNRITATPGNPQYRSGLGNRYPTPDQPDQLVTNLAHIPGKRHGRRNLSIESVATTA